MEANTAGCFWRRLIMESVGSELGHARQGHCLMLGITLAEIKAELSSCTLICHFVICTRDWLAFYKRINASLYCMRIAARCSYMSITLSQQMHSQQKILLKLPRT